MGNHKNMKRISKLFVIGLLLGTTQAVRLEEEKVTDETAKTINDAVKDVLKITQDEPRVKVNHSEEHHHHKTVAVPGLAPLPYPAPGYYDNPAVARGVAAGTAAAAADGYGYGGHPLVNPYY